MDNNSDEDIPIADPEIQVIKQGDPSEADASHWQLNQSRFRVVVPEGTLAAATVPSRALSYFEWSIVTDPKEIDGGLGEDGGGDVTAEGVVGVEETAEPESMDNDEEENGPDQIDNLEEGGRNLDDEEAHRSSPPPINLARTDISFPGPGLLKGYEYTTFKPTPINHNSPETTAYMPHPTQPDVLAAMEDLRKILHPRRDTGQGYKDPEIDLWRRARLEGMMSMFHMFTNQQSHTYNKWGASACQTAIGMGRGNHCARQLCALNRGFLADRTVLPLNPYGDWNESLLVNEDLVNEISIYLLSLGNDITAKKLMDFLHRMDIKEKYGIERDISHKTACRYLQALGYRYQSTPKGQYVDGHEREDVVTYRKQVFLPKWKKLMDRMVVWDKDLTEHLPSGEGKRVIVWFHDESVFYAHDRRKKGWYHKDASARPYAKGEGASLMIADFISADFGWLISPDGKQSARRLFKPGKNRDGYFSNEDIIEQADEAMDILLKYYPEFDHVLVYDNATTHLKRADDALSARKMPKGTPKPGKNWGIEVSKRDPITGKAVYCTDGSVEKTKILMQDGRFENGEPQPLYFPMDHPDKKLRGVFKGMAVILEERGFGDMSKVRAECKGFKCKPGETRAQCCCRRILYNQPDFSDAESLLEKHSRARGIHAVIFLPKFHCELNFIEQCWGRAKSVYRTYPPSSREEDLEANTLRSLDSIPLPMMRKFATRSRRFMDAYDRGLNGKQAAWAARKYRGHRVLPPNIFEELEKGGVV